MTPKISVIIPVHNGAAYLRSCLSALSESTFQNKEVIVVDDASNDASSRIASEFDCELIRLSERGGPGRARNTGCSRASGDILFFTDADVVTPPDLLERIARTMRSRPDLAGVIGGYSKECGAPNFVSVYKNLLHHFVHRKYKGQVGSFFSACGAIRRNVFQEHGGFDESERDCALEDVELGMRIAKSGKKVLLDPDLQVIHLKRYSIPTLVRADVWQRAVPYTLHMLRHRVFPDELSTSKEDRWSVALAFLNIFLVGAGVIFSSFLVLAAASIGVMLYNYLSHEFYRFLWFERGGWFLTRAAFLRYLAFIYSGVGLMIGVCMFRPEKEWSIADGENNIGREPRNLDAQWETRVNPNVLGIIPHQPTELADGLVRLSYNENPIGPSPLAMKAISEKSAISHLSRYPDSRGSKLKEAIAARHGVKEGNVLLGQGASELLEIVTRTFVMPGDEVIVPVPTFPWYEMLANIAGARVVAVPLLNHFVDLSAIARSVTAATKVIVIANPNNPTGTTLQQTQINEFLDRLPVGVVVVFDEAYIDFVEGKLIDTVSKIDRGVIVVRSFSKSMGLAGLRIGYALACERIVDLLSRIRRPYNTSHLAQAAALAAIGDTRHLERTRHVVRQGKQILYKSFSNLGIDSIPSDTNFILVDHHRDPGLVYQELLSRGFVVRPMPPTGFRVSVGTIDQTLAFVSALEEVLGREHQIKGNGIRAGADIAVGHKESGLAQVGTR